MKTAKFIRDMKWEGDARLYELSHPISYGFDNKPPTRFVIVSGVCNPMAHETYIFPSNFWGDEKELVEIRGSFQGDVDHERALEGMGFKVRM